MTNECPFSSLRRCPQRYCVAVVVEVDVDEPVFSGSLADATAATELDTKLASLLLALPEALCDAAVVVPAAPAA
ncbi:hypothetical protein [Sodalis sp. (in: enterobacteria)]|uniref:hypothetical protein n=1 Tax=Sodalis sp. (in: enterobacteria) TaxID=1898979 RepID=UPI003F32F667